MPSHRSWNVIWSTLVLVPAALLLEATPARACDVQVGERVDLYTDGAAVTVRMAADRVADVPAVMWNDNATGELQFRKYVGPGDDQWDPAVVVDTAPAALLIDVNDDYPRLWRMFALAFDPASEPHVVFVGEVNPGDTKLYYVHRIGADGWSVAEELADLPDVLSGAMATYEPWIEADFDASGRLHVAYHCYGGGSSTPACSGKILTLVREDGAWSGPHLAFQHASGMDMAVGADGLVHLVTLHGGGNQHQAFYKSSQDGIAWPSGEGTQITSEPPGDCYAGPVSCWPSITTDRDGNPYVAYGVDPDPCCVPPPAGPAECTWPNAPALPEPQWVPAGGSIKVVRDLGSGWNSNSPELALQDVSLHGSLPEISIDPVGIPYVVGPNFHREVGFDALSGSWSTASYESEAGARWLFLDTIATGDGGWVAYPRPPFGHPAQSVSVKHFSRTGSCSDGPACTPGQSRACGDCGTQLCGSDSQWQSCAAQGECYPESTATCGGLPATCSHDCQWDVPCGSGGAGGGGGTGAGAEGAQGGAAGSAAGGQGGAPAGATGDGEDETGCACSLPSRAGQHGALFSIVALLGAVRLRRSTRSKHRHLPRRG